MLRRVTKMRFSSTRRSNGFCFRCFLLVVHMFLGGTWKNDFYLSNVLLTSARISSSGKEQQIPPGEGGLSEGRAGPASSTSVDDEHARSESLPSTDTSKNVGNTEDIAQDATSVAARQGGRALSSVVVLEKEPEVRHHPLHIIPDDTSVPASSVFETRKQKTSKHVPEVSAPARDGPTIYGALEFPDEPQLKFGEIIPDLEAREGGDEVADEDDNSDFHQRSTADEEELHRHTVEELPADDELSWENKPGFLSESSSVLQTRENENDLQDVEEDKDSTLYVDEQGDSTSSVAEMQDSDQVVDDLPGAFHEEGRINPEETNNEAEESSALGSFIVDGSNDNRGESLPSSMLEVVPDMGSSRSSGTTSGTSAAAAGGGTTTARDTADAVPPTSSDFPATGAPLPVSLPAASNLPYLSASTSTQARTLGRDDDGHLHRGFVSRKGAADAPGKRTSKGIYDQNGEDSTSTDGDENLHTNPSRQRIIQQAKSLQIAPGNGILYSSTGGEEVDAQDLPPRSGITGLSEAAGAPSRPADSKPAPIGVKLVTESNKLHFLGTQPISVLLRSQSPDAVKVASQLYWLVFKGKCTGKISTRAVAGQAGAGGKAGTFAQGFSTSATGSEDSSPSFPCAIKMKRASGRSSGTRTTPSLEEAGRAGGVLLSSSSAGSITGVDRNHDFHFVEAEVEDYLRDTCRFLQDKFAAVNINATPEFVQKCYFAGRIRPGSLAQGVQLFEKLLFPTLNNFDESGRNVAGTTAAPGSESSSSSGSEEIFIVAEEWNHDGEEWMKLPEYFKTASNEGNLHQQLDGVLDQLPTTIPHLGDLQLVTKKILECADFLATRFFLKEEFELKTAGFNFLDHLILVAGRGGKTSKNGGSNRGDAFYQVKLSFTSGLLVRTPTSSTQIPKLLHPLLDPENSPLKERSPYSPFPTRFLRFVESLYLFVLLPCYYSTYVKPLSGSFLPGVSAGGEAIVSQAVSNLDTVPEFDSSFSYLENPNLYLVAPQSYQKPQFVDEYSRNYYWKLLVDFFHMIVPVLELEQARIVPNGVRRLLQGEILDKTKQSALTRNVKMQITDQRDNLLNLLKNFQLPRVKNSATTAGSSTTSGMSTAGLLQETTRKANPAPYGPAYDCSNPRFFNPYDYLTPAWHVFEVETRVLEREGLALTEDVFGRATSFTSGGSSGSSRTSEKTSFPTTGSGVVAGRATTAKTSKEAAGIDSDTESNDAPRPARSTAANKRVFAFHECYSFDPKMLGTSSSGEGRESAQQFIHELQEETGEFVPWHAVKTRVGAKGQSAIPKYGREKIQEISTRVQQYDLRGKLLYYFESPAYDGRMQRLSEKTTGDGSTSPNNKNLVLTEENLKLLQSFPPDWFFEDPGEVVQIPFRRKTVYPVGKILDYYTDVLNENADYTTSEQVNGGNKPAVQQQQQQVEMNIPTPQLPKFRDPATLNGFELLRFENGQRLPMPLVEKVNSENYPDKAEQILQTFFTSQRASVANFGFLAGYDKTTSMGSSRIFATPNSHSTNFGDAGTSGGLLQFSTGAGEQAVVPWTEIPPEVMMGNRIKPRKNGGSYGGLEKIDLQQKVAFWVGAFLEENVLLNRNILLFFGAVPGARREEGGMHSTTAQEGTSAGKEGQQNQVTKKQQRLYQRVVNWLKVARDTEAALLTLHRAAVGENLFGSVLPYEKMEYYGTPVVSSSTTRGDVGLQAPAPALGNDLYKTSTGGTATASSSFSLTLSAAKILAMGEDVDENYAGQEARILVRDCGCPDGAPSSLFLIDLNVDDLVVSSDTNHPAALSRTSAEQHQGGPEINLQAQKLSASQVDVASDRVVCASDEKSCPFLQFVESGYLRNPSTSSVHFYTKYQDPEAAFLSSSKCFHNPTAGFSYPSFSSSFHELRMLIEQGIPAILREERSRDGKLSVKTAFAFVKSFADEAGDADGAKIRGTSGAFGRLIVLPDLKSSSSTSSLTREGAHQEKKTPGRSRVEVVQDVSDLWHKELAPLVFRSMAHWEQDMQKAARRRTGSSLSQAVSSSTTTGPAKTKPPIVLSMEPVVRAMCALKIFPKFDPTATGGASTGAPSPLAAVLHSITPVNIPGVEPFLLEERYFGAILVEYFFDEGSDNEAVAPADKEQDAVEVDTAAVEDDRKVLHSMILYGKVLELGSPTDEAPAGSIVLYVPEKDEEAISSHLAGFMELFPLDRMEFCTELFFLWFAHSATGKRAFDIVQQPAIFTSTGGRADTGWGSADPKLSDENRKNHPDKNFPEEQTGLLQQGRSLPVFTYPRGTQSRAVDDGGNSGTTSNTAKYFAWSWIDLLQALETSTEIKISGRVETSSASLTTRGGASSTSADEAKMASSEDGGQELLHLQEPCFLYPVCLPSDGATIDLVGVFESGDEQQSSLRTELLYFQGVVTFVHDLMSLLHRIQVLHWDSLISHHDQGALHTNAAVQEMIRSLLSVRRKSIGAARQVATASSSFNAVNVASRSTSIPPASTSSVSSPSADTDKDSSILAVLAEFFQERDSAEKAAARAAAGRASSTANTETSRASTGTPPGNTDEDITHVEEITSFVQLGLDQLGLDNSGVEYRKRILQQALRNFQNAIDHNNGGSGGGGASSATTPVGSNTVFLPGVGYSADSPAKFFLANMGKEFFSGISPGALVDLDVFEKTNLIAVQQQELTAQSRLAAGGSSSGLPLSPEEKVQQRHVQTLRNLPPGIAASMVAAPGTGSPSTKALQEQQTTSNNMLAVKALTDKVQREEQVEEVQQQALQEAEQQESFERTSIDNFYVLFFFLHGIVMLYYPLNKEKAAGAGSGQGAKGKKDRKKKKHRDDDSKKIKHLALISALNAFLYVYSIFELFILFNPFEWPVLASTQQEELRLQRQSAMAVTNNILEQIFPKSGTSGQTRANKVTYTASGSGSPLFDELQGKLESLSDSQVEEFTMKATQQQLEHGGVATRTSAGADVVKPYSTTAHLAMKFLLKVLLPLVAALFAYTHILHFGLFCLGAFAATFAFFWMVTSFCCVIKSQKWITHGDEPFYAAWGCIFLFACQLFGGSVLLFTGSVYRVKTEEEMLRDKMQELSSQEGRGDDLHGKDDRQEMLNQNKLSGSDSSDVENDLPMNGSPTSRREETAVLTSDDDVPTRNDERRRTRDHLSRLYQRNPNKQRNFPAPHAMTETHGGVHSSSLDAIHVIDDEMDAAMILAVDRNDPRVTLELRPWFVRLAKVLVVAVSFGRGWVRLASLIQYYLINSADELADVSIVDLQTTNPETLGARHAVPHQILLPPNDPTEVFDCFGFYLMRSFLRFKPEHYQMYHTPRKHLPRQYHWLGMYLVVVCLWCCFAVVAIEVVSNYAFGRLVRRAVRYLLSGKLFIRGEELVRGANRGTSSADDVDQDGDKKQVESNTNKAAEAGAAAAATGSEKSSQARKVTIEEDPKDQKFYEYDYDDEENVEANLAAEMERMSEKIKSTVVDEFEKRKQQRELRGPAPEELQAPVAALNNYSTTANNSTVVKRVSRRSRNSASRNQLLMPINYGAASSTPLLGDDEEGAHVDVEHLLRNSATNSRQEEEEERTYELDDVEQTVGLGMNKKQNNDQQQAGVRPATSSSEEQEEHQGGDHLDSGRETNNNSKNNNPVLFYPEHYASSSSSDGGHEDVLEQVLDLEEGEGSFGSCSEEVENYSSSISPMDTRLGVEKAAAEVLKHKDLAASGVETRRTQLYAATAGDQPSSSSFGPPVVFPKARDLHTEVLSYLTAVGDENLDRGGFHPVVSSCSRGRGGGQDSTADVVPRTNYAAAADYNADFVGVGFAAPGEQNIVKGGLCTGANGEDDGGLLSSNILEQDHDLDENYTNFYNNFSVESNSSSSSSTSEIHGGQGTFNPNALLQESRRRTYSSRGSNQVRPAVGDGGSGHVNYSAAPMMLNGSTSMSPGNMISEADDLAMAKEGTAAQEACFQEFRGVEWEVSSDSSDEDHPGTMRTQE
ncbi:unnamed protein product [Amoebophrya sp. A120]|nr:unnamed protein product [Amoebophrya sp. A120]|eukprot:GSA120T00009221001.1